MRQARYFNNNKKVNPVVLQHKKENNLIFNTNKLDLLLTYTVLHFKFGFGKKRLDRFKAHYDDLLDSYAKGYITTEDLNIDLEENVGIKVF
jgi:hypothetical protein